MPAPMPTLVQQPEAKPKPANVARNADSSAIITLAEPVQLDGETISKVTLPGLRGKHLMHAPDIDETFDLGKALRWLDQIVEPVGVVGELVPVDCLTLVNELMEVLRKKLRSTSGGQSSQG